VILARLTLCRPFATINSGNSSVRQASRIFRRHHHEFRAFIAAFDRHTEDKSDTWSIRLFLDGTWIEWAPLTCRQHVVEGPKADRQRFSNPADRRHVFGYPRREFLLIPVSNVRVGFHDDPRQCAVGPSLPRAFRADYIPVGVQFFGILTEIPNVALS